MKLINNLVTWRKKNKMTQEELAKEVEVSRQTIIAIEKGDYVPSLLLGMRIAGLFETKVEAIFEVKS